MKVLETKNITKRFEGVRAVDSLSLQIAQGKITAIVGPNGSGKTTLINVLTGMMPFEQGNISIAGVTVNRLKPHEIKTYGVTRTFQDIRLFEQMTVFDNILVVLTKRNVFGALLEKHHAYYEKKTEEVLRRVDLWDAKNQLASQLSYGQRKLLEIARALAMQADVYLFDEPFAGLFPEMRKIVSLILQKLKKQGKTVVLIEHNMAIIRELAEYVFVMNNGSLLAAGTPQEALAKREVVEAYLGG